MSYVICNPISGRFEIVADAGSIEACFTGNLAACQAEAAFLNNLGEGQSAVSPSGIRCECLAGAV